MHRVLNSIATAFVAAVLFVVMALPAWAAAPMTLTFVRHGQSTANAAGILNTAVPGPNLTTLGQQQAQDVAAALAAGGYDGIYASTMVRTQQTAAPLAARLGESVVVLPGLQEIGAGVFEGSAERGPLALLGYAGPPLAWTFGLRAVPILGSADSGNAFDARVDSAVKTIYDAGDLKPVVFSHGATIMFWVMMNVDNPDPLLILTHPLDNTDVVVVTGDPDAGWTLTDWDGVRVDPNPSLITRLFVVVRDVVAALQGGFSAGTSAATREMSRPTTQTAPTTGVSTVAHTVEQPAAAQELAADIEQAPAPHPSAAAEPGATATISRKSTKRDDAGSITSVESKEGEQPDESAVAANGATDLSDGNMARPGTAQPESVKPKSADSEGDQAEPTPPTKVAAPHVGEDQADDGADTAAPAAA